MTDQAAVWDAFRDQVSRGLARHPEATIAHLAAEFTPASRTEARAVLAFAAAASTAYDAPEPWPEPDGPGPSCNWCGRTDPGGGLTGTYPAPDRTALATVADPVTPLGISYARPGPAEVRTMAGDLHCVDEERCQQEREAALPVWRHHQFGDRRRGQEPAWLTRLRDDAEVTLTGCAVVGTEVGAWLRLQREVEARVLALAADQEDAAGQAQAPYYVQYDPQLGHWMHTMRNQDNRTWTLGYKLAAMPQASSAPDALAADAVAGQKDKPKRRRRRRR